MTQTPSSTLAALLGSLRDALADQAGDVRLIERLLIAILQQLILCLEPVAPRHEAATGAPISRLAAFLAAHGPAGLRHARPASPFAQAVELGLIPGWVVAGPRRRVTSATVRTRPLHFPAHPARAPPGPCPTMPESPKISANPPRPRSPFSFRYRN